uniref:hypothetical protein n=1 Tax=Frankia sp. Cr1 TaxID=3073931 RepID=UPI002AD54862
MTPGPASQHDDVAPPGTAFVFSNGRGRLLGPPHPPTRSEIMIGHFRKRIDVDVTLHPSHLEEFVPSALQGASFKATVVYSWCRTDPKAWVANPVDRPEAHCAARLLAILRPITQSFAWDNASDAARAASNRLVGRLPVGHGIVVDVSSVDLVVDPALPVVPRTPHSETFDVDLPTDLDTVRFRADVEMLWHVSDPLQWRDWSPERERQAAGLCRGELVNRVSQLTRSYRYDQPGAAEQAVIARFGGAAADVGFGLSAKVQLVRLTTGGVAPDLARHEAEVLDDMPSDTVEAPFHAKVEYAWQIVDPALWTGQASHEVEAIAAKAVLRELRRATRTEPWRAAAAASAHAEAALCGQFPHPPEGLHLLVHSVQLEANRTVAPVGGQRSNQFRCELPSARAGLQFSAAVGVTWRITDPVAWQRRPEREAEQAGERAVRTRLREICRQFGYDDAAGAERRALAELAGVPLDAGDGVQV